MWIKKSEYNYLKKIEQDFSKECGAHAETSKKLAEYEHPEKYKPGYIVFNRLVKNSSLDFGFYGWYRWYEVLNLVSGDSSILSENNLDDFFICEQHSKNS